MKRKGRGGEETGREGKGKGGCVFCVMALLRDGRPCSARAYGKLII